MTLARQETALEKAFISSIEYTLFIPGTLNSFRTLGKHTIDLDVRSLDQIRNHNIENTIELLSGFFGGCTVNADHFGAYFDGKNIVRERGTQISVIVPAETPSIKFTPDGGKETTVSVPEFIKLIGREIKANFNQDSVLITARPIYAAFIS